jgi:cell division protein FtsI/penicillin-binding protein 2
VRTSIDLHVQDVAESVLSSVTEHPAAIVALRPSTGEILASASVPQRGFNRSLLGRYPPGSTFKVITSTALLEHGTTTDTRITCPHDVTIGGRMFQNAEDEELGDISFATAFAHSCNTAFIQLAERLQPVDLVTAAQQFGFNAAPAAEVAAQTSSYPEPAGMIDQVSSAIGQGRVLATPLQMASVAATVASGVHRDTTFRHLDAPPAGTALPPGIAPTLQSLMRRVVSEGTAASAHLPPGTGGKTGTAEFGSGNPPQTHAWFIGFRGDLAFAVIVEDGGFGGAVAAPLARDLLRRL